VGEGADEPVGDAAMVASAQSTLNLVALNILTTRRFASGGHDGVVTELSVTSFSVEGPTPS
jgi:hypothetical protein